MKILEPHIKRSLVIELQAVVSERWCSQKQTDLASYSRDSNFRSAIQAFYGDMPHHPGLIVWPATVDELSHVIKIAGKYKTSVVFYAGGSGVCGGALSDPNQILIDLKRMNKLLRVDKDRLFIDVECGVFGKNLEEELNRRGLTLGHFPSSIMAATVGGYLATRSAGQLSSKYGKIEDMIIDLEFVDGLGKVHRTCDVNRYKGIDFNQLIIGSEGTLGVITKARLKVYPLAPQKVFLSYQFPNMTYGLEAMRRIMQTGLKPAVLRLYNELDSLFVLGKSADETKLVTKQLPDSLKNLVGLTKSKIIKLLLKQHRLVTHVSSWSLSGCCLIVALEGFDKLLNVEKNVVEKICKDLGGDDLGPDPAEAWKAHRYSVSYKASPLFLDGGFTDTIEVATTWKNINNLYQGVLTRLSKKALVLAHVSHVYSDGAAIYFTVIAPQKGERRSLALYDDIWQTALKAVQDHGGIVSHHHGIGRLKKEALKKDWGHASQLYKHFKSKLDPQGILNPGVLR